MAVGDVPSFLVQASIPGTAKPGVYSGEIVVTGVDDTGKSFEMRVPLQVRVRDILLYPEGTPRGAISWLDKQIEDASIAMDQYVFILQELMPKLEGWRKTDDDGRFIDGAKKLLVRCNEPSLSPGNDASTYYAKMGELADTIERGQFMLKARLHNVTIGRSDLPNHTVLNSSVYTLSTGEIVVIYNVSVYLSDALTQDSQDWRMVSADGGLTWKPYTGSEKLTQAVKLKSGALRAGQAIYVPRRDVVALARDIPNPSVERYPQRSTSSGIRRHVVRRGETLSGIAKRYGTSAKTITKLNGLKSAKIIPGQSLVVSARAATTKKVSSPKPTARKTSAATPGAPKASAPKASAPKATAPKAKAPTTKAGAATTAKTPARR